MSLSFNPNAAASADSGVFGLPFTPEQAKMVLIPVPWEATTSYGGGTSEGPEAILQASRQVDLYDLEVEKPYSPGIAMLAPYSPMGLWNTEGKAQASLIIKQCGNLGNDLKLHAALDRVNALSKQVNEWVEQETAKWLETGKIVGIVGGDHSVPFGAMKAMGKKNGDYGILHFDAHSDTRNAYEGFKNSHASIFRNVIDEIPQVIKLVQVAIRDICEEEMGYVIEKGTRIEMHSDQSLKNRRMQGENWAITCQRLVKNLPKKVWISFDIDGLDPKLCPNTGTPVPGGLELNEAVYLIGEVARTGRQIVGFDLNEVSPGEFPVEWDANVGARLLYKLCAWTFASQGLCAKKA